MIGVLSGIQAGAQSIGINPIGEIKNVFQGIFGGGSRKTAEKVRIKKDLISALRQHTTAQERREFVYRYDSSGRIKPTPEGMAYFFSGEGDWYHRNVGSHHQRFLDDLPGWINRKIQNAPKPNSTRPGAMSASRGTGSGTNFIKQNGLAIAGGALLLIFVLFNFSTK